MTSYVEMKTRIADELLDSGALTTAQISAAILSAIRNYQRKPFYFNQKKASTFSTVADQEYYTSTELSDIPNIVQMEGAKVTVNSYKRTLRPLDFETIEDGQDGTITGAPSAYCAFNQKIRLYPIPDAVYTVTLAYVYRLTALSADGDTNAWVDEVDAEELIRQSAKRILALDILHDDELAVRCYNREAEVLADLLAETRRRLPNTTLTIPAMPSMRDSFNINTG